MKLLQNILIQPNVITKPGIDTILNHIKTSSKEDLSVFDPERSNTSGTTEWTTRKEVRDTQHIEFGHLLPSVHELLKNIVHNVINPYYGFEVKDSELPQLLRYGIAGHYSPHVDGESVWKHPDGSMSWRKSVDRDLSVLIYLNDDYKGGDLFFPDLKIRIKPEPGMLVCFPSTHHYVHGVEPVTEGERFAIVTWMTVKGFETLGEQNERYSKIDEHMLNQTTESSVFQL